MEKDGYWLGGSGYGYGYPLGGAGYGYSYSLSGQPAASATGYQNARPGYEVRNLIASANILARHGQQQRVRGRARDDPRYLQTLRGRYAQRGSADGGRAGLAKAGRSRAAQPVTSKDTSFRSDELLGTDVRNPQNEALGSVDDLVMSPQTGKIAYLVIARGGIFGIDEKYVPVPWEDFKITPNANLLVLDTTKAALDAAPAGEP